MCKAYGVIECCLIGMGSSSALLLENIMRGVDLLVEIKLLIVALCSVEFECK